MFGRKKAAETASPTPQVREGAKNRPTPKRSVAEAANRRPLVPPDRKVAGRASREQLREQRARQRQALITGDERNLPARDAGPVRRFIRDYVDARYNVGDFLLPVFGVVFVLSLTRAPGLVQITSLLLYVLILVVILDTLLLRFRLRRALTKKFGSVDRGIMFYALTRTLQIRRFRMPRPQNKRGEYPT